MSDFWSNVLYSCVALLILIAVMGVVYAIYTAYKTKKQQTYFKELHQELSKGKRVTFSGGLYGKLVRVGDDTCDVELKSGAIVEVSRYAIQGVDEK